MPPSISLDTHQRNTLLRHYRGPGRPEWRLRAHILLLLADGVAWAAIATLLYTSPSTIARCQSRFRQGGLDSLFSGGRPCRAGWWAAAVVRWVLELTPAD